MPSACSQFVCSDSGQHLCTRATSRLWDPHLCFSAEASPGTPQACLFGKGHPQRLGLNAPVATLSRPGTVAGGEVLLLPGPLLEHPELQDIHTAGPSPGHYRGSPHDGTSLLAFLPPLAHVPRSLTCI